jgi:uncharacterized coiled-coil protein SlyX
MEDRIKALEKKVAEQGECIRQLVDVINKHKHKSDSSKQFSVMTGESDTKLKIKETNG